MWIVRWVAGQRSDADADGSREDEAVIATHVSVRAQSTTMERTLHASRGIMELRAAESKRAAFRVGPEVTDGSR